MLPGQVTLGEAPPLAATLRAPAAVRPEGESGAQVGIDMTDMTDGEAKTNKQRTGLGWEGDWYRDESRKSVHRDLVRAGIERARQQGKRIGRHKVTGRLEFTQRFADTLELIRLGELSLRQAARELSIGYATLKRLIDAQERKDE